MQNLRTVIRGLPAVNFSVLKYLMRHICHVADHGSTNLMSGKNLSVCFWPTLLRPNFTSFEKMALCSKQLEDIIYLLIKSYGYFFHEENEV